MASSARLRSAPGGAGYQPTATFLPPPSPARRPGWKKAGGSRLTFTRHLDFNGDDDDDDDD
eukprot:12418626-Karenia_brevis.AAC.1